MTWKYGVFPGEMGVQCFPGHMGVGGFPGDMGMVSLETWGG